MELQATGDGASFLGREGLVEGGDLVGIQMIEHDADDRGVRVGLDDSAHALREVNPGAALLHQHFAPTSFGFADPHQVTHTVALIFGIVSGRGSRLSRQGRTHFTDQWLRALIEAHHGTSRIVRFGVQVPYVFHRRNKFGAHLGNTPFLDLPGFQGVFLKADERSRG